MNYIETEKFVDTAVCVKTLLPLKKETITALNVLLLMRRSRTEKFDTKQKFTAALNLAYGLKVMFGLTGYGRYVCLDMRFLYIRPDYVDEEGYEEQVLDLLKQVLDHPLLTRDNFEEARYLLRERLKRQKDDPESLALEMALGVTQEGHSITIPVQGSLEDLETLTYEDVLNVQQELSQAPCWVAVSGAVSPAIAEYLNTKDTFENLTMERELIHPVDVSRVCCQKKIAQTSLVQVWATGIDIESDLYYPLLVFNSILGQGPMSLLFEEIREKHSYCYSISSMLLRFDGAMLIVCGTERKNLDHVRELIRQEIERVQLGDIDPQALEIAKMDLKDMLISQADRPFGSLDQTFFDTILHRSFQDTASRIAMIDAVTLEQVQEAASRMKLAAEACVKEERE